jgi:hypothetical protein
MYRPPSSDESYYNAMIDNVMTASANDSEIILCGDLNFDYKLDLSLSRNPIKYIEDLFLLNFS